MGWIKRGTAISGLVLSVLVVAGCGGGPSVDAAEVVEELSALYPAPNARDNTGFCASSGCEQMVTTDAVTVSQWPDAEAAAKWTAAMANSDARQAGLFVLTFTGEQDATSTEARDAYTAKASELSAA